ncbi:hypothetical protein P171DRAFT_436233, partial [Karstenula rhodostoma CBS 690.94]
MSFFGDLLNEVDKGEALPNRSADHNARPHGSSARKRPQQDSPVILVGPLKADVAALKKVQVSLEASMAHQDLEHPIGEDGYCKYNANNFGEIRDVEAIQREVKALREENRSLKLNQQAMNNRNDYRIHKIEMARVRRMIAVADNDLARTQVQLGHAHTVLSQHGLPIPRANDSRRSESSQATLTASSALYADEYTSRQKRATTRTPTVCQLWLKGKCKSSAARCARRGFLHEVPEMAGCSMPDV